MVIAVENKKENYPLVSVVMPVLNEGKYIHKTLSTLLSQDYPREFMEIIIADGLSKDQTWSIVKSFQTENPQLVLIENSKKSAAAGLNAALRVAKGEIIVRMDGHTRIASDYVRQCIEELKRTGADNVGGKMNAEGENYFGDSVAIATSTPFGVGNASFHYADKEDWVDTVYLGAWRREVFGRIGVFDENVGRNEDDEFNYRLLDNGGRIFLTQKIKSKYIPRSNPFSLSKQYFVYGFWKVRVFQKHPRQVRWRHFIPPVFALCLITGLILYFMGFSQLLIGSGVLYAAANFSASIISVAQKGWKYLGFLPLVFLILHLSYGFGFLAGLIRFSNRWRNLN